MMNKCLEIPAGASGNIFLRECLENGMAMGEQLLRLVDEVPGEVTALLSQGSNPAAGLELTSEMSIRDGTVGGRAKVSLACLSKKAQGFLADSDHVLVIEDALFGRQAPFLSSMDLPRFYCEDKVYWYLTTDDRTDIDKAKKTLAILGGWGSIGIMTSWPPDSVPCDRHEIGSGTLSRLVADARRIVVEAYDGEGYLIWYRGGWEGR